MSYRYPFYLLVTCLPLATVGCIETVDSGSVSTDEMWADFEVTADDSSDTRIQAGLKTEGPDSNTYAELTDGDKLVFYVNGESHQASLDDSIGDSYAYAKTVSESAGGTSIRIAFERGSGTNAPKSTVTLPDQFRIDAPEPDDTFSRERDDVWIKLDGSDPEAENHVTVEGPCLERDYENDFSGRSITIPHDELESDDLDEDEDRCELDVTIERRVRGTVDEAYQGGEIVAKQVRKTSFQSVP